MEKDSKTKGYTDVDRVLDHIERRTKEKRRDEFIKKMNQDKIEPTKKEIREHENNSRS